MPKPNDPATVSICVDDVTPQVGQNVTLSIVGDDPDAIFPTTECGVFITWEGQHASFCRDFVIPWGDPRPTPKEEPGHVLQHHAHTYDTPGTKTVTGSVWSAEYDGYTSPYSSRAIAALEVTGPCLSPRSGSRRRTSGPTRPATSGCGASPGTSTSPTARARSAATCASACTRTSGWPGTGPASSARAGRSSP